MEQADRQVGLQADGSKRRLEAARRHSVRVIDEEPDQWEAADCCSPFMYEASGEAFLRRKSRGVRDSPGR